MSDFSAYMSRKDVTAKCRAERDSATARLELALMHERCAEVMSQHEPLNTLGLDREAVRRLLCFLNSGRLPALDSKGAQS